MTRFRNDLFPGVFFALVLLGLPGGLLTEAADAASEPPAIAAADVRTPSNEQDVLKTVLETRDEVRALRREVEHLRKILESTGGKNESNPPFKPHAGGIIGRSRPPVANGVCFFDAQWCGPCRQMRPLVEQLKREGLPIVVVDVDQRADLKRDFDIEKLPTFVLLIRERETERVTGLHSEAQLRALLAKVPKGQASATTSNDVRHKVWNAKEVRNAKTELATAAKAPKYAKCLQQHEGEKIDQIIVEGNVTIPTAAILEKLKTEVGGKAIPAQIQEDIHTLLRTRWFFTVEPKYGHTDKGLVLVLAVSERSIVRSVKYLGASELKPERLVKEMGLKVGTPYEVSRNKEAAERLEAFYHERGYIEATVDLVSGDKPEQRDIVFRIHEGIPQKVIWRYFVGNTSVSGERLAMELKSTPAYAAIGGEFRPTKLAADSVAVQKYYENLGFFDTVVTPTVEYSKDRKWIYLRYQVEEGRRYRIRNFRLLGNTRFKTDELLKEIKTQAGEFYDAVTLKKDVETITKKYDTVGYGSKLVTHLQHFEQPGVVDVAVEIIEDSPYEVRPNRMGKTKSKPGASLPPAVVPAGTPRVPSNAGVFPMAYPVADLVVPLPGGPKTDVRENFERLVALVTDTVEPKTWDKAGGAGSITSYEPNLMLVIRQSQEVHRQIRAFLLRLRSLHDWQVCLELDLVDNAPADVLRGIGVSSPWGGDKRVLPLTDEQRTKLLAAVDRTPTSKLSSIKATMYYGQHGSIRFGEPKNQAIDAEIADSTDRYSVNLRFDLQDLKIGQSKADPVTVNVPNLKTVAIEFNPIGAGASAKPSLLIVRPRLLFPFEEQETRQ